MQDDSGRVGPARRRCSCRWRDGCPVVHHHRASGRDPGYAVTRRRSRPAPIMSSSAAAAIRGNADAPPVIASPCCAAPATAAPLDATLETDWVPVLGVVPGSVPGFVPGSVPGFVPGSVPGFVPGSVPGSVPGFVPGVVTVLSPTTETAFPPSVIGSVIGATTWVPPRMPSSPEVPAWGAGPDAGAVPVVPFPVTLLSPRSEIAVAAGGDRCGHGCDDLGAAEDAVVTRGSCLGSRCGCRRCRSGVPADGAVADCGDRVAADRDRCGHRGGHLGAASDPVVTDWFLPGVQERWTSAQFPCSR